MPTESAPWALTIPSDLRLLPLARAFIEAVCSVAGLDETMTHQVVLATDEATNNVMRHAHHDRPDSPILLQCFVRDDRLEIRLHDEGEPFDVHAVPHLDPAELRAGGRGVFLMRRLMDEVTTEPRRDGGNVLRLVKRFSKPVAPAYPS
jgi:anti-sigma regulatory factor (Ser/Thr protein kinase)